MCWITTRSAWLPNNLTFVVVGDVDATAIATSLEKFSVKYARASAGAGLPSPETNLEQVGRRVKEEVSDRSCSQLSLAWRIPGLTNPARAGSRVAQRYFGIDDEARCSIRRFAEKQRAWPDDLRPACIPCRPRGVFIIQSVCEPGNRKKIEDESLAIAQTRQERWSQLRRSLRRSRRSLLSAQLNNLGTMRGRASDLGSNWLLTQTSISAKTTSTTSPR